MFDADLWHALEGLNLRVKRLKRRCRKLEQELGTRLQVWDLKRQLLLLQAELEKLRAQPTQLVIQKLENRIDHVTVSTLEGIMNIGVALNQSGALDANQVKVGGQSMHRLLQATASPEPGGQAGPPENEADPAIRQEEISPKPDLDAVGTTDLSSDARQQLADNGPNLWTPWQPQSTDHHRWGFTRNGKRGDARETRGRSGDGHTRPD